MTAKEHSDRVVASQKQDRTTLRDLALLNCDFILWVEEMAPDEIREVIQETDIYGAMLDHPTFRAPSRKPVAKAAKTAEGD